MWRGHFGDWGGGFCGLGGPFAFGNGIFGMLFTFLFWGLIAYLVFSIFRDLFSRGKSQKDDSAFAILRDRYATGEITEDEYLNRKATLSKR